MKCLVIGVTVPNISYHFKRIFSSGELDPEMVIKEILITAQSGVRGISEEKVKYYNLDAILSLGYRVNSVSRMDEMDILVKVVVNLINRKQ